MSEEFMHRREAVINEAYSWIGTPFVHQAMVKKHGVGCGTFLIAVYGACGFDVPKREELGHFPAGWHLHARDDGYLHILERFTHTVTEPAMGDICLFKLGRAFGHSGIILEWPRIIHARDSGGVMISHVEQDTLTDGKPVKFLSPFK